MNKVELFLPPATKGGVRGGGACVRWQGGMRGQGVGGVRDRGVCMAVGCAWRGDMHGEGGMRGMHAPFYVIRLVNARAVRILLECILVLKKRFAYEKRKETEINKIRLWKFHQVARMREMLTPKFLHPHNL